MPSPTHYTAIRIPVGSSWTIAYADDPQRLAFLGAPIGAMSEPMAKMMVDYLNSAHAEGFAAGARHVADCMQRALRAAGMEG